MFCTATLRMLPVFFTESANDTVLAYQIGAGVGIEMHKDLFFDITYRYFATTDPEFGVTKAENSSSNTYAGIRFNF